MAHVHGAPIETFNLVGLQSSISCFQKCIQLYSFQENPSRDTRSFDIRRDIYPRLKKLPQKYKYLSEDRKESEGAMISFQNGTKVRRNVCCI